MSDLIPSRFADVTPNDTTYLPNDVIGLYVGGAGTVRVQGKDAVSANFTVASGQYLTGNFNRVLSTRTTATGIVAQRRA